MAQALTDVEGTLDPAWLERSAAEQLLKGRPHLAQVLLASIDEALLTTSGTQAWQISEQLRGAEAVARAAKPDPRIAEFQKTQVEARQKANADNFDGALLVLDKVQRRMQGHAPFHYHVGLYSLRYGQQSMARNGSGRQIAALLADARVQLQKSVQLDGDPVEPRLHLAQANYESGEFVNAAKISSALAGLGR